ncbi:MAG: hypothetical protein LBN10_03655 [Propionibacteriaceae bacterium]|jgi:hypothetical protein|nr:hypothetical protein [Propionibacteriaceae bacterium]
MSALEVEWIPQPSSRNRLHLVAEGEMSAASLRHAHARRAARAQAWATAKGYAAVGAVVTVFASAAVTMVWSFLSVPNVPLP